VVTHADGYGGVLRRAAALAMLDTLPGRHPRTIAADKAYDTRDFVQACRERRVTPHLTSHAIRRGGSDQRQDDSTSRLHSEPDQAQAQAH
jgi:hypothetical protein